MTDDGRAFFPHTFPRRNYTMYIYIDTLRTNTIVSILFYTSLKTFPYTGSLFWTGSNEFDVIYIYYEPVPNRIMFENERLRNASAIIPYARARAPHKSGFRAALFVRLYNNIDVTLSVPMYI